MPIHLLSDHNFDARIVRGLSITLIGLDVVTLRSLGLAEAPDDVVLAEATATGRTILTHDAKTFPDEIALRLNARQPCARVLLIPRLLAIGQAIDEAALVLECGTEADWVNRLLRLPLPG